MIPNALRWTADLVRIGGYGAVLLTCWPKEPGLVWSYSIIVAGEVTSFLARMCGSASHTLLGHGSDLSRRGVPRLHQPEVERGNTW